MLVFYSDVARISKEHNKVSVVISPPTPAYYRAPFRDTPGRGIAVMRHLLDLIFYPIPCIISANAPMKSSYDRVRTIILKLGYIPEYSKTVPYPGYYPGLAFPTSHP